MVSDMYREVEQRIGNAFMLQGEFVKGIAHHLNRSEADIERALYLAGVSTGLRAMELAGAVNEFLACLNDVKKDNQAEEETLS